MYMYLQEGDPNLTFTSCPEHRKSVFNVLQTPISSFSFIVLYLLIFVKLLLFIFSFFEGDPNGVILIQDLLHVLHLRNRIVNVSKLLMYSPLT